MSIEIIKLLMGLNFLFGLQTKLENILLLKLLHRKLMMKMGCLYKVD